MSLPSQKRTFKRPRAGKIKPETTTNKMKLIEDF